MSLLLTLFACIGAPGDPDEPVDADGDGFSEDEDCNDASGLVNPDAPEICDGKDNDCDGLVDVDAYDQGSWYLDADGDGFGSEDDLVQGCTQPSGTSTEAGDCDDSDKANFPGNTEICDGQDNDCDAQEDEGLAETWYDDRDRDGYGDPDTRTETCTPAEDQVQNGDDCDDDASGVHPGAAEVGCDGVDNNCNGDGDELQGSMPWYPDSDGDGLGEAGSQATYTCEQPEDSADNDDDCNDDYASITVCDRIYEMQDGTIADGTTVVVNEVVVTGISSYGFFAEEETGGAYSGVYAYGGSGSGAGLALGDRVGISGTLLEYNSFTELDFTAGWVELLYAGSELSPDVVSTADLASDGEPWEGVLVQVQGVTVRNADLGFGEWSVDDGVRVDDLIYSFPQSIKTGDSFGSITAPLYYSFGNYKLVPGDAGDFQGFKSN